MSTHPKTRAKFYVESVHHNQYGATVHLSTVHDSAINTEDNAFNASTPSGKLEMFLQGQETYLDFTLVSEGQ